LNKKELSLKLIKVVLFQAEKNNID
jgi:hypothetical protein